MGTNFYARIIPTKERRENLKRLIDEDKFREIKDEVQSMYGNTDMYTYEGAIIHIGKMSGGWKFLWNSNWHFVNEGEWDSDNNTYRDNWVVKKYYDLNKDSIREFLSRDDVEMFNEYGEKVDGKTFVDEIVEHDKQTWIDGSELYDGKKYDEEHSRMGEKVYYPDHETIRKWAMFGIEITHHEFYSDGLRFSSSIEFS